MDKLFCAFKPSLLTSNTFLKYVKNRYKEHSAGYSGTLDPFARGVMILAFGRYTKLFRFLKKTPKTYRATIFLGVKSQSWDIENVESVDIVKEKNIEDVKNVVLSIKGDHLQVPPKYSAKWVDGKRAYKLARAGVEFEISPSEVTVFDVKFIHYSHPFITFECCVSEGTYIRTLGYEIANRLGEDGALSYLERLREGEFYFDNERSLDPFDYMDLKENFYLGSKNLDDGPKLYPSDLKIKADGVYFLKEQECFRIIEIVEKKVKYLINSLPNFKEDN